jgi:hypothetical protein
MKTTKLWKLLNKLPPELSEEGSTGRDLINAIIYEARKEIVDCVEKSKVTADYYQSDGSIALEKGDIIIGREYWKTQLKEWGLNDKRS